MTDKWHPSVRLRDLLPVSTSDEEVGERDHCYVEIEGFYIVKDGAWIFDTALTEYVKKNLVRIELGEPEIDPEVYALCPRHTPTADVECATCAAISALVQRRADDVLLFIGSRIGHLVVGSNEGSCVATTGALRKILHEACEQYGSDTNFRAERSQPPDPPCVNCGDLFADHTHIFHGEDICRKGNSVYACPECPHG